MRRFLAFIIAASIFMSVNVIGFADQTGFSGRSGSGKGSVSESFDDVVSAYRKKYIAEWNSKSDYQRYNMSTKAKAAVIGMKVEEYKFFARVVQAEGDDLGDDITDKVLVACVILNRSHCKKFTARTVTRVLKKPNQFEVVGKDHNCHTPRTKDSEWAIMIANQLVSKGQITCHLTYFNSINFMRGKPHFAFFGGNYFSTANCNCENCKRKEPFYKASEVKRFKTHFYRPKKSDSDTINIPVLATATPMPTEAPQPSAQPGDSKPVKDSMSIYNTAGHRVFGRRVSRFGSENTENTENTEE